MTAIEPIRREVLVNAGVPRAFALFTQHLGSWWPLAEFGVFGDGTVAVEDRLVVERSGERSSVWAEVLQWDPPDSLKLNWHPGSEADSGTEVTVRFTAQDEQTLVSLVHRGWERKADPATAAREYGHGWPIVLAAFAVQAAEPDRWFALMHRPGPALAPGESIFDTEAFGEHVAFLSRLRERGLLVAAGPLAGQAGAGMTVVRVQSHHGSIDVAELATLDDQCVATGYLSVDVQPWQVMFADIS